MVQYLIRHLEMCDTRETTTPLTLSDADWKEYDMKRQDEIRTLSFKEHWLRQVARRSTTSRLMPLFNRDNLIDQ